MDEHVKGLPSRYTVSKETSQLTGGTRYVTRFDGVRIGSANTKREAEDTAKWHFERSKQK